MVIIWTKLHFIAGEDTKFIISSIVIIDNINSVLTFIVVFLFGFAQPNSGVITIPLNVPSSGLMTFSLATSNTWTRMSLTVS